MRTIKQGSVGARALRSVAAGLVVVAVFAVPVAAAASGSSSTTVRARTARLGPRPVRCRPAPCGQPGQPPLASGQMQESTKVHLTITPHVARPGQIVTMKITYSGDGHCLEEQGSTCGPQGAPEISLVRVDCHTHKLIPSPTLAHPDETTQCFEVAPGSAVGAPYYGVIQAPIGECGATNSVFDCISEDYLLIEPPCMTGPAAVPAASTASVGAANVRADSVASDAASGSCPLTVSVKVLGPGRAGLGGFRHFSHEGSKAYFIPPDTRKCASGCSNV
jgi:hypothetical protein